MKRPKKPVFNIVKPLEYFTDDVYVREIELLDCTEIDITQFKPEHKYRLNVETRVDYWDDIQWTASIYEYEVGKRKNPQYDYEMLSYNMFKE